MVKLAKRSDRLPGIGIMFTGCGRIFTRFPVEESTIIILHSVDELENRTIIVKGVSRKPDGTFIGKVFGFEPPSINLGDLTVDGIITFVEDEIFGAIKED